MAEVRVETENVDGAGNSQLIGFTPSEREYERVHRVDSYIR